MPSPQAFLRPISLPTTVPIRPAQRCPRRPSPRAVLSPVPSSAVLEYERFLRSEARSGIKIPDAPVFETADGALVCEWNPPAEPSDTERPVSAMMCIADYEAFLATNGAAGVDPTVPVYCTPEAALVCHYDG